MNKKTQPTPPDPKTASFRELRDYWAEHDPVRKAMGWLAVPFLIAAIGYNLFTDNHPDPGTQQTPSNNKIIKVAEQPSQAQKMTFKK